MSPAAPPRAGGAERDDPDELVLLARRSGRQARRALTGADRAAAESAVVRHLLGLDELGGPGAVALSRPTDGEVDLGGAVPELVARGWRLHLPVVGEGRSMSFRAWDPGEPTVPNRFGIEEPPADGRGDLAASALDVVVLPCTAVDRCGRRLGFGAGYYDRALADAGDGRGPLVVCVAFDVQVVGELPVRPWDVPADVVVTETGVRRPGP